MKFIWALPLAFSLVAAIPQPAAEPGLEIFERDDPTVALAADVPAGCVKRCSGQVAIGPAACNPQGCQKQDRNGNCRHFACSNSRRQVCQNGFENRCYFST